ncbi:MAG: S9 family peptidase, partial [Myxococcota bacterium]
MRTLLLFLILVVCCALAYFFWQRATSAQGEAEPDDPFVWLEDIDAARSLDWVEQQNRHSQNLLTKWPGFEKTKKSIVQVLDSQEKIAWPTIRKDHVYNFWRDAEHVRGILRRKPLREYLKEQQTFETVLDVDKLAQQEGENWVYKGSVCLQPDYRHCMVSLSRGGADATVKREFDMQTKTFVKDGFFLPEAKSSVTWIDKDNLFIGTDFGSDSLTQSGYPNEVRLLQRGQLYKEARLIFAGDKTDVSSGAFRVLTPDTDEFFIVQAKSFHTARYYHVQNHKPVPLSLPEDFDVEGMFKGFLLCKNKKALIHKSRTIVKGSLVAVPFQSLLAGEVDFQVVYAPDERSSYQYS